MAWADEDMHSSDGRCNMRRDWVKDVWKFSLLSFQFFDEPKITPKFVLKIFFQLTESDINGGWKIIKTEMNILREPRGKEENQALWGTFQKQVSWQERPRKRHEWGSKRTKWCPGSRRKRVSKRKVKTHSTTGYRVSPKSGLQTTGWGARWPKERVPQRDELGSQTQRVLKPGKPHRVPLCIVPHIYKVICTLSDHCSKTHLWKVYDFPRD